MAHEPNPQLTLVFAPGCHRDTTNWRELVWGSGPFSNKRGNLAKALELASRSLSSHLMLGGGNLYPDGITEAKAGELLALDMMKTENSDLQHMRDAYDVLTHRTTTCKGSNTATEIDELLDFVAINGFGTVIYVCMPFHAPRAAKTLFGEIRKRGIQGLNVLIMVSDNDLEGGGIEHCVTAEPPHRGDDKQLNLPLELRRHVLMRGVGDTYLRLLRTNSDRAQAFGVALSKLVDDYAK